MTDQPQMPQQDEQSAEAFCRRALKRAPEASYKEVRREAWDEGIKVTRKTFSIVQREIEDGPQEERQGDVEKSPDEPQAALQAETPDDDRAHEQQPGERVGERVEASVVKEEPPSRQSWDDLFKGAPSDDSAGEDGQDPHAQDDAQAQAQDGAGRGAFPSQDETPTESARRALGLLSSPAATDEPRQNAVEFMANCLRENPEASYREVRDAAEANGYTVSSATFGRAQAIVGILADEEPTTATEASRESSRPEEALQSRSALRGRRARDPASLLEDFIDAWEGCSFEQSRFKEALREMLKVVEHALEQK